MAVSYILGIETTCDETSASLLKNGGEIISNVVYSQIDIHKKYAGVVPELASRAHAAKIAGVVKTALGGVVPDYIAFANGPGLPGGLLVGRVAAETLGMLYGRPVIGVNHLEGHLFACEFTGGPALLPLEFPLVSLIVSGGHTELWLVKDYGVYKLLGRTRDDAAGEA
ncbi:MAG: tRNA (adenosine(37)-N6)-threonylcarbamoyltransferase complex transferase subunit TsaD, partial [Elusimicrobiota bacterium]|nr:tRNA (adenosine(37)-N6)-threonylcarbamoyltransferase complex transferase subunit TsaD [Elusimicrobiota bacterium]